MNAMRRLGRIGIAAVIAIAAVVQSPLPASAADPGWTRYENVGNPGWCLDGDQVDDVYLYHCNSAFQVWYYTAPMNGLKLRQTGSLKCITVDHEDGPNGRVFLYDCDATPWSGHQQFDARGQNGWVYFIHASGRCLFPKDTHLVKPSYSLGLMQCPGATGGVANILAWRYYR